MAALHRDHVRAEGRADQREVSQQVEHLVPDELVLVAQVRLHHAARVVDDDRVFDVRPLSQPLGQELVDLAREAERPRPLDLLRVGLLVHLERDVLRAQHGDGVGERVAHRELLGRDGDEGDVVLDDVDGVAERELAEGCVLVEHAGLAQDLGEGRGAPVADGDLLGVELDLEVVDPAAVDRREEVLDGVDVGAVLRQAGAAEARYGVVARRGEARAVREVDADERHPRAGQGGQEPQLRSNAREEPGAGQLSGRPNRSLGLSQGSPPWPKAPRASRGAA